jgi:hypothetical protein
MMGGQQENTGENTGQVNTMRERRATSSLYTKREYDSIRAWRGLAWLCAQRKCGPYSTVLLSVFAIASLFVVFIFVVLRHRLYMT